MKAIIFDLDGTLIQTMQLFRKILQAHFKYFQHKKISEMLFYFSSNKFKPKMLFKFKSKFHFSFWHFLFTLIISLAHYQMKMFKAPAHKYAVEVLEELKPKYKLFLLTNARRFEANKKMNGLKKYFDGIICHSILIPKKPNSKGLKILLKKYDLKKGDAVLVGDSISDYIAAKKVGMKSILVLNSLFSNEIIKRETSANIYIDSIRDLPEVIRKLS